MPLGSFADVTQLLFLLSQEMPVVDPEVLLATAFASGTPRGDDSDSGDEEKKEEAKRKKRRITVENEGVEEVAPGSDDMCLDVDVESW